ncbi:MAG: hypothetical protein ACO3WN_05160 [Burkholderiaceae bacterium]
MANRIVPSASLGAQVVRSGSSAVGLGGAVTWVIERPSLGPDGRPESQMLLRGWKRGQPVASMNWKEFAALGNARRPRGTILLAAGDGASPLPAELVRAFAGFRIKPLGQAIAPRRAGRWRVYLAQDTLTLAYGPSEYFSLALPQAIDQALIQAQDLIHLAARQNPPKPGGIQAFFSGPAELTGPVQRLLSSIAAPVHPLPLAGGFAATWQSIPLLLRAGLVALAGVSVLLWLFPQQSVNTGSESVTQVPVSPSRDGQTSKAQEPQGSPGLADWLGSLSLALDRLPSGVTALSFLEIMPSAVGTRAATSATPEYRVRLQTELAKASPTLGVPSLGSPAGPGDAAFYAALSALPGLLGTPERQSPGLYEMRLSSNLFPRFLGLDPPLSLVAQAQGLGLRLEVSVQTAQEIRFLIADQPVTQVLTWLWAQPAFPAGWIWTSLRIRRGSQQGLVTLEGRVTP